MSLTLHNHLNSSSLPVNDNFNVFTVTNIFNTIDEFFIFYRDVFVLGPQFGRSYFIFLNNQFLLNLNADFIKSKLIELSSEHLDLSLIGIDFYINNNSQTYYSIERNVYKIETPRKRTIKLIPDAPMKKRNLVDF